MILTPRCGDQEKMVIPGVEAVHEKVKSVRQVCLLNEGLPFLLANQYLISQPLSSQPQPAPHKHETEVVNPQYLLHWQRLIPQNQIAAVYVPQRMLPNPDTKHWTCQVKAEIRRCSSLPPLTDPFANPRTAAFAVPRQQRDQSPGEREPERPHKRTPGGIGASVRETHHSVQSQSRALTVRVPFPNKQHKGCVYPHPLSNAGRDEHTS